MQVMDTERTAIMTENTENSNNPNEPQELTETDLEDVSGGVISYSIRDLAKLLPEPTRSMVNNLNNDTEDGERKFLTALESELLNNGHSHEAELVSYYKLHHWEPIDSHYRSTDI